MTPVPSEVNQVLYIVMISKAPCLQGVVYAAPELLDGSTPQSPEALAAMEKWKANTDCEARKKCEHKCDVDYPHPLDPNGEHIYLPAVCRPESETEN